MADTEKLKELILFISDHCKDKPMFGATHLNKILYFADFLHYKYTGRPISDSEYFKLEAGPAPKQLVPAREQLIGAGLLEIRERPTLSGYIQKRPTPTGDVSTTFLTDEQKQFIRDIANQACTFTASDLSGLTHKHLAWQLAGNRDDIPFFTIHCTKVNAITAISKNWALELYRCKRVAA